MKDKDKIIEKQRELIRNLKLHYTPWTKEESDIVKELESELAALDQEGEEKLPCKTTLANMQAQRIYPDSTKLKIAFMDGYIFGEELNDKERELEKEYCSRCKNYDDDSICKKCDDSFCMFKPKDEAKEQSAEEDVGKVFLSKLKGFTDKPDWDKPSKPQSAEELYKKVYIKSEADLPPKDGLYFCGEGSGLHYRDFVFHDTDNFHNEGFWLKNIDWYLIPIEQSQREITDEEIEKWAAGKVNEIDPDEYGYGDLLIDGAKWMREQLKQR